MRILLTGGRGLVGGPLTERLRARDGGAHDVRSLAHGDLDVTDAAAVRAAFSGFRPDAVVHLAAWTDVDGCERDPAKATAVNGDGARRIAEACAAGGASLLHVSTDYVFDGRKTSPWTEDDPTGPVSSYGRSKLEGEEHVRRMPAGTWTVVRAQSIYGAGKKSFVDAILDRARSGQPLRVVTDQRVSPTWCDDLADALADILFARLRGLYHAANAGSCTWNECARAALDLAGMRGVEVLPTTAAELARPAPRPANSSFDCVKLRRDLGRSLRPWRDALAAYLSTRTAPAAKEAP